MENRLALVAGCAAIGIGMLAVGEVVAAGLGVTADPRAHTIFFARGALTAVLVVAFAVWYSGRARRQLEAARARMKEQIWREEQAAGLSAFSRILAHEVRNPLNSLVIHTTLLERVLGRAPHDAAAATQALDVVRAEATRLGQLVTDYEAYAAADVSLSLGPVELGDAARAIAERHQPDADVEVAAPAAAVVRADRARVEELMEILVERAIHANAARPSVRVALRRDGLYELIEVSDGGAPFADPKAVFRPFFTKNGGRSGFGLARVRDIARAHGGDVDAGNVNGRPTVVVRLPAERA